MGFFPVGFISTCLSHISARDDFHRRNNRLQYNIFQEGIIF